MTTFQHSWAQIGTANPMFFLVISAEPAPLQQMRGEASSFTEEPKSLWVKIRASRRARRWRGADGLFGLCYEKVATFFLSVPKLTTSFSHF